MKKAKRGRKPGVGPGIVCPTCGGVTFVVETRVDGEDKTAIRRRRECLDCGDRLTTYERVDGPPKPAEPVDRLMSRIKNEVRLFLIEEKASPR